MDLPDDLELDGDGKMADEDTNMEDHQDEGVEDTDKPHQQDFPAEDINGEDNTGENIQDVRFQPRYKLSLSLSLYLIPLSYVLKILASAVSHMGVSVLKACFKVRDWTEQLLIYSVNMAILQYASKLVFFFLLFSKLSNLLPQPLLRANPANVSCGFNKTLGYTLIWFNLGIYQMVCLDCEDLLLYS